MIDPRSLEEVSEKEKFTEFAGWAAGVAPQGIKPAVISLGNFAAFGKLEVTRCMKMASKRVGDLEQLVVLAIVERYGVTLPRQVHHAPTASKKL